MAYALLAAGIGDKARDEAVKATVLDPKSALAFRTLGWTLQFNSICVQYGRGFDLQGAISAYLKAKSLDPTDAEAVENLAILYEYDSDGARYASVAGLDSAIREYRALRQLDKDAGNRYEDNLLFAMLYAHQYKQLLSEMAPLPVSSTRDSLGITAVVATEGVAAGLKKSEQISGDSQRRNTALRTAGFQLTLLRLYPEASEILSAGLQGEDAPGVARQIETFRSLRPYDPKQQLKPGPEGVVEQMMALSLTDQLTEAVASSLLTRNAYATDAEWQKNLKKAVKPSGALQAIAARSNTTSSVLADIMFGTMKANSHGDDQTGYTVSLQLIGSPTENFFVTKESDGYKIVASGNDNTEVGNEALYLLHHGDERQARSLLDWKRDLVHKGGGDDPLAGPFLPRFWTTGESTGANAIELAAASLLVASARITSLLPAIAVAREKAASSQDKLAATDLGLLLAAAYVWTRDGAKARTAASDLLKAYPDSVTAIEFVGQADYLTKDWADWNTMLDSRLSKHPTNRELLLQKAGALQAQGDFAGARKTLQVVLDGGQAVSNDYNFFAWNALFENKVDAEAAKAGQQANMLSKNASFADLHTLACVYAAQGKSIEARQVLSQAMAAANLAEPNSVTWFAFGAIYEDYGVLDAAVAAFNKVEKPDQPPGPTDTYILAQNHLTALHAL